MRSAGKTLLLFLCGFLACAVLGELTPVCTLAFWRLAYAEEFVLVGNTLDSYSQIKEAKLYLRVLKAPHAEPAFRLLYTVGNKQGQAFALMGLNAFHSPSLPAKLEDYDRNGGSVDLRATMCLIEPTPVSQITETIRNWDALLQASRSNKEAPKAK